MLERVVRKTGTEVRRLEPTRDFKIFSSEAQRQLGHRTYSLMIAGSNLPDHPPRQDVVGILDVPQWEGLSTVVALADGHGEHGAQIAERASADLPLVLQMWLRAQTAVQVDKTALAQTINDAVFNATGLLGSAGDKSGAAFALTRIFNGRLTSVVPSDTEVMIIKHDGQVIDAPKAKHLSNPVVRDEIIARGGVFNPVSGYLIASDGAPYGLAYTFGDRRAQAISSSNLKVQITENDVWDEPLDSSSIVVMATDGIRKLAKGVEVLTGLLHTAADITTIVNDERKYSRHAQVVSGLQRLGIEQPNVVAASILKLRKEEALKNEWLELDSDTERALLVFKQFVYQIFQQPGGIIPDDISIIVIDPSDN